MAKINVTHLHNKLAAAGIPIDGIALDRPGKPGITIDFREEASLEQRAEAQAMVDAYDPDEAAPTASESATLTEDEISNAKTVADLKALMLKAFVHGKG